MVEMVAATPPFQGPMPMQVSLVGAGQWPAVADGLRSWRRSSASFGPAVFSILPLLARYYHCKKTTEKVLQVSCLRLPGDLSCSATP